MNEKQTLNTDAAYYVLFREVNRAIEEIDRLNFGTARDILILALKKVEEIAISEE